ncbi:MAG TPA: MFS transporter [Solirubrobacteraceae bacterium]|nr:MFS transporter [Solirubrobacteraceae bacterium]
MIVVAVMAATGGEHLSVSQRGVLLSAAAATALTFFDQTATTSALHDIEGDLHASVADLQWIVGAYLLTLAAFVPAAGRLADVFGLRRMFLAGVQLFAAASIGCALSPSIGVLIALRAVQGTGGALVVPLALATVAAAVSEQRRGWAIGVLATGGSTFLSLGPLIAGGLVDLGGWRWVFAAGVPVSLLSLWAGHRWIEESTVAHPPRVNVRDLSLLALGLGGVVSGLLQMSSWGVAAAGTIGLLAGGIALLSLFAVMQHREREPVLALSLLRLPNVGAYLVALLAGQFTVTALTVELMLYLQRTLGYDPFVAGLLFLPTVIATPLLSPAAGRLADRGRGGVLVPLGLLAAAAAMAWIAALADRRSVWLLLPALCVFGLSRPFLFTPSSTAPVQALPGRERALAASLVTESYQLGAALGIAVAGCVVGLVGGLAGFRIAIAIAGAVCLVSTAAMRVLLGSGRSAPVGGQVAR